MNVSPDTSGPAQSRSRQQWMGILARTPREQLGSQLMAALGGTPLPAFDWLRAPDIGLAMVRGRIGGTGDPFNLGEVTVTRATLRLRSDNQSGPVGFAVHRGRDKERARLAALADAMLQLPDIGARLQEQLLEPLARAIDVRRGAKEAQAARTKVEFFTMVRGD